jgi:hypothetical protein
MAVRNVLIEHSPEQVWQVPSDGWAYPCAQLRFWPRQAALAEKAAAARG